MSTLIVKFAMVFVAGIIFIGCSSGGEDSHEVPAIDSTADATLSSVSQTADFSGNWVWHAEHSSFSLDLLQTGDSVFGWHTATAMDARRIDAVLPEDAGPSISGVVVGDRVRITFHSGYSDISGTAMLVRRGEDIYWEVLSAEQGEYWLPDTATLTKFEAGGFDDDDAPPDSSAQPEITSSELIGVWQASPMMAAGWNATYQFFGNGRFIYHASQMGEASRQPERSGTWSLDRTTLALQVKLRTIIEGGTVEQGPGGEEIVGGTEKTVSVTPPEAANPMIETAPSGDDVPYRSIMIGDEQFWQFDRDPNAYP